MPVLGAVVAQDRSPRWLMVFPDRLHEGVALWLQDLAACDCSPLTLRSYGYDLLRWLRFLHAVNVRPPAWRWGQH